MVVGQVHQNFSLLTSRTIPLLNPKQRNRSCSWTSHPWHSDVSHKSQQQNDQQSHTSSVHKLRGFHSSPLQRCGDCEQLLDSPAVPNGVNWTEWTAQIFTQLRQRSTAHHHWGERSVSTQTHIRVTSASSSAATHRSQRTGLLKTPVAH